jgi:RHH-type proline utilization regulon transcriptional repressor/proline dehydrogenase/delta 1-pyrroline-5-carboxylate dehydrogenase
VSLSSSTKIAELAYWDEEDCVRALLQTCTLDRATRQQASARAEQLISLARSQKDQRDVLDAFLEEFGLNTSEGVALMCLAEALLRIPDADTADELIAEKMLQGNWRKHIGHSESLFVNASTWGLLLTGKWIALEEKIRRDSAKWLSRLVDNLGEPVVRQCMLQAMRIMGKQYILGQTIQEALKRGPKEYGKSMLYSFDALGEGARTQAAADHHYQAYVDTITALKGNNNDIRRADSVSIKLSALHPRYQCSQRQRVFRELLPRIVELCQLAKAQGVGLSIDAEEAERLDIELEIFQHLAVHPELIDWPGLGFVLQAYQKRAVTVADWLISLSQQRQAPICVRLVKGAYWDQEIKRAQQLGLKDYPVFTRKVNTDLSYVVCAQKLFDAGDKRIYPQLATHNALTIATICSMAKDRPFELQRLHGMGELLYDNLSAIFQPIPPVRIYAPIGGHQELLPYLVRRLLENGANSSFVNRFLDADTPASQLSADIIETIVNSDHHRHSAIPRPDKLYSDRPNSRGLDLENPIVIAQCQTLNRPELADVNEASAHDIDKALTTTAAYFPTWQRATIDQRSQCLVKLADILEQEKLSLMALIGTEAGRTLVDSESEVREAIEFCQYYNLQARLLFDKPKTLEGPTGEDNSLSLQGRGVFLCISPWNFPLAIFVGQIAAALITGNTVIAKPAEQTPRVAKHVVEYFYRAGVPKEALQLLPGDGPSIGKQLISDHRVQGIAFTGSTATARIINQQLATRQSAIVPFIAETGGINAMMVDSTALIEQVVDDVVRSAFYSAGQRCSALRLLIVHDSIADDLIAMLTGACEQLRINDPLLTDTDIGPVIDSDALEMIETYIAEKKQQWPLLYAHSHSKLPSQGNYVGPHIFEVPNVAAVEKEVFGPVLHLMRYHRKSIDQIVDEINQVGYGLTFGIHSRIETWAAAMASKINAGNVYINRNMIGAVVGVQPFGGMGLSGTGPKAGGPHYLPRFANEKTVSNNTVATGGNAALLNLGD